MYFLYILIALAILLTLFLCSPVTVSVYYEYVDKVSKTDVTISFFKIIKIKFPKKTGEKKEKKAKPNKKEEKEKLTFNKLKTLLSGIKTSLSDSKSDISILLSSIKKHLVIDKMLYEMEYGLSDAAKTGVANGALWGILSGIFSIIDNISEIKDVTLNIWPVFDRECLNLRFHGIISIKFTHIISNGIRLLKIVNYFSKNINDK